MSSAAAGQTGALETTHVLQCTMPCCLPCRWRCVWLARKDWHAALPLVHMRPRPPNAGHCEVLPTYTLVSARSAGGPITAQQLSRMGPTCQAYQLSGHWLASSRSAPIADLAAPSAQRSCARSRTLLPPAAATRPLHSNPSTSGMLNPGINMALQWAQM